MKIEEKRHLRAGGLLIGCLLAGGWPAVAGGADLSSMWLEARGGSYRSVTREELQRAEALFLRELRGEEEGQEAAWRMLDWERRVLPVGDRRCVVLRESARARRGRGFYLIEPRAGRTVLQIPHGYRDRDTGRIGLALAVSGRFLAVAWNTVPRDRPAGGGSRADLAHLPESYFTAFSRAVARSGRADYVVQLHGFARGKRRTPAGRGADFILSSGSRRPTAALRRTADCLGRAFGVQARVFPAEVRELGALTNRQAAVLRQYGGVEFLHVEMSRGMRKRLREHPAQRRALLDCLP